MPAGYAASFAAICRDLPAITRDGRTQGLTRGHSTHCGRMGAQMADDSVSRAALPKQFPASNSAGTDIAAAKTAYYYPLIKHLWHAPLRYVADQEIVYRDLSS